MLENGYVWLEKGLADGLHDADELFLVQDFLVFVGGIGRRQNAGDGRLEEVTRIVQKHREKQTVQRSFDIRSRLLKI